MLEQPCSEYVGCHLGEDSALLGVLFARGVVVVTTVGAVAAADAGVARVTCKTGISWTVLERKIYFAEGFLVRLVPK